MSQRILRPAEPSHKFLQEATVTYGDGYYYCFMLFVHSIIAIS